MESLGGSRAVARPIAVRGRWVCLAPPSPEDYPAFYEWRNEIEALRLWIFGSRRVVVFEEFVPDLERFLRDGGTTLVVINTRTARLEGFALAYNFNPADGWAWIGCYGAPHMRGKPYIFAEAAAQFITYLFSQFPLRKLYVEIYEFNPNMMRLIEKLGFREEERLSEHAWMGDRYWDSIHYSLSREDWEEAFARLKLMLKVEADLDRMLHPGEAPS